MVSGFESPDFDSSTWDDIPVPAHIQSLHPQLVAAAAVLEPAYIGATIRAVRDQVRGYVHQVGGTHIRVNGSVRGPLRLCGTDGQKEQQSRGEFSHWGWFGSTR